MVAIHSVLARLTTFGRWLCYVRNMSVNYSRTPDGIKLQSTLIYYMCNALR